MKNKALILILLTVLLSGCNRGAMRLYGAGDSFPASNTAFHAQEAHAESIFVAMPVDKTAEHYGKSIAGTSWQGTRTDTFDPGLMTGIVRTQLMQEIETARLFSAVDGERKTKSLVLETEVRAFGAQVRGFLFSRIGGVASFQFTLKRGNKILLQKVYEEVVRDGDPDYTGPSFGMIEDGMRSTMSDSLREVLKKLFADLEGLKL